MFITFEGIDYSGKTTQYTLLLRRLVRDGVAHQAVREPGGTTISERIRELLLDRRHLQMEPEAELLLFSAARAQLVREVILPALRRGVTVVADRFHDSSTAYQGYGRGIPVDAVRQIHAMATAGLEPDVTLLFDIPVEESLRRRSGCELDRMETADMRFFEAVRQGFLTLAAGEQQRFVVLDGMRPIDDLHQDVLRILAERRNR